MRLAWLLVAVGLGCGAARIPASLRGYEILVERQDSIGTEMARAFRERGFRVRRAVRGGGRPAAALIAFTFRAGGPADPASLHLRLADTRTGVIVAATTVALDSVSTARGLADAAVRGLATPPSPTAP